MSAESRSARRGLPGQDFFDLAGSDPELVNSGRIPDPAPAHTPLFRWLARVLTWAEARLRARGGKPLRTGLRILWALIAAVGVFLLVGPVINKPLDFDAVIAAAKVDQVDWAARDVSVDYEVSRADDGGFSTTVEERYTADFINGPEPSIERVLVTEYEGHDAEFAFVAATIDGEPASVKVERDATTTTIRIEAPDGAELSGQREVTVAYELHNLIAVQHDEATGGQVDVWRWQLFGELWPQATKGIEVSVLLPRELDDALVRQPQAYIGWLILSNTEWLDPEERTAEGVRYRFTNGQALPAYPDILIKASFEPGTFSQPATTTLFWWQSYGPLLPLVVLVVLVLFAAAARRVVWADSAGDPWYLPRSDPPKALPPGLAAALLGKPGHAELLGALSGGTGRSAERGRAPWYAAVARAARRAGRWGNVPATLRTAARWRRTDEVVEQGLRWVPDSYVRDFFVFAPIAITLLQWGLLRQLSHQVILAVVWWPAAMVLAATLLAAATLVVVHRPRPLTPKGALLVQQLKGVHVFARVTRLLDRGPLTDKVIPYAALFLSARRAGSLVFAHAAREAESPTLADGWRGARFVTLPTIFALIAAAAVLAGTVTVAATTPPPFTRDDPTRTDLQEIPGVPDAQPAGFDLSAELTRDASGAARLDVVERFTGRFTANSSRVPQFARDWPTQYLGQDLGWELGSVRIDGENVPVREIPRARSTAVVTQLREALSGVHEIEVRYALRQAAVNAGTPGEDAQQVRWAALFSSWEDLYLTNPEVFLNVDSAPVRPIRVQLTVAPELTAQLREGGWIDDDSTLPRIPWTDGNAVAPWRVQLERPTEDGKLLQLQTGSKTTRSDGALVVEFDIDETRSRVVEYGSGDAGADSGGPFTVSPEVNETLERFDMGFGLYSDLGALLSFEPGTFTGVEPGAAERFLAQQHRPYTVLMWGTGILLAAALLLAAASARSPRGPSLSLRLAVGVALPAFVLAQCVAFWWMFGATQGAVPGFTWAIILSGIMLVAVAAAVVLVRRSHARVRESR